MIEMELHMDFKGALKRLVQARHSIVVPREHTDAAEFFGMGTSSSAQRLPAEFKMLRDCLKSCDLHSQLKPYPKNGWMMGQLDRWPVWTINEGRRGDPVEYPYLEDVWQIAHSAMDGGVLICVDLHKGPSFGHIALLTHTDMDYGGGAFVIAGSLGEWLSRTLELAPEADQPYWFQPGFVDYEPLIPDDPFYSRENKQRVIGSAILACPFAFSSRP